jgi:hypothetical protein
MQCVLGFFPSKCPSKIEKSKLKIFEFPSYFVILHVNTGARQGGSSLPVSAHARTLNPPPP